MHTYWHTFRETDSHTHQYPYIYNQKCMISTIQTYRETCIYRLTDKDIHPGINRHTEHTYIGRHAEPYIYTDRHCGRQICIQAAKDTDRHRHIHRHIHTGIHSDGQTNVHTETYIDRNTDREKHTDAYIHTNIYTETTTHTYIQPNRKYIKPGKQKQRGRDRQTDRYTYIQRYMHTERGIHTY